MQTTTTLSGNLYSYYFKNLLENAKKKLRLLPLGMQRIHPKGYGNQSFMLKFGHVLSSTTPLTEGVTPTEATIATNKYTITLKQYGQHVRLSDFLIFTAIDPVIEDVTKELGYTAAKSVDDVIRDYLIANATNQIFWASTATTDNTITSTMVCTAPEAIKGVRYFRANDAPEFDDGAYVWVVHPFQTVDMFSDTAAGGFIELNKYVEGLADGALKGEVGKVYGARVVESSNMVSVANASSVNVYRSLMFAKDAFAVTTFDKNYMELIVNQLGSAKAMDPLSQLATVGYKLQFGVQYVGGPFAGSTDNLASPDLMVQIRTAATGG